MTASTGYRQTIRWLEELYHRPVVPADKAALRRCRTLLRLLDNPQQNFRTIHVVGSSGKGSTTTMVAEILSAAGHRTGSFRSPHLQDYRERIAFQGEPISEEQWTEVFEAVRPVAERMQRGEVENYELGRPSLFEVLFAMACVAFCRSGAGWAAMEAGLGGRLDPSNVLAPDVVIVTNVSLEHTQLLGNTTRDIAAEKAAVIKPGASVVTATADGDALNVIRKRAALVRAPLSVVDEDVRYSVLSQTLAGQTIQLSAGDEALQVDIPLAGGFQARNVATAWGAVRLLNARGVHVPQVAFLGGLAGTRVPGRFEVVHTAPRIVLDGAHSPAAIAEVAQACRDLLSGARIVVLFSAMGDKDVESMVRELAPMVAHAVVTSTPDTDRGEACERLASAFCQRGTPTEIVPEVGAALRRARNLQGTDATLLITGSLYLVGWCRSELHAGGQVV